MTTHQKAVHSQLRAAACDYAHLGNWRIVPGPLGQEAQTHNGDLRPVFPSPSADLRRVNSWWKLAPYSILALAGDSFDVISTPMKLGILTTKTELFQHCPAPVSLSAERMHFLVSPGCTLQPELNGYGITLEQRGTPIPLPPTCIPYARVTWWIQPETVGWQLGSAIILQAALHSMALALREGSARSTHPVLG